MATNADTERPTFGDWVKAKREARGMSQMELAERSKPCSQGYISNLERNVYERKDELGNQPNKELVIRLAQALKASETEALDAAGYFVTHPELNTNQLRAADLIVLLPEEKQEETIREIEVKVQLYGGKGGGGRLPTSEPGDETWTPPIGKVAPKKKVSKKNDKREAVSRRLTSRRTA